MRAKMHIDLPHGSVELREPDEVTEAGTRGMGLASLRIPDEVRKLQIRLSAATTAGDTAKAAEVQAELEAVASPESVDAQLGLADAMVLAFVRSWSYEQPLTPAGLVDLPAADYAALRDRAMELAVQLNPDFSDSDDPASPTLPSNA